jgi:hypothetical protein
MGYVEFFPQNFNVAFFFPILGSILCLILKQRNFLEGKTKWQIRNNQPLLRRVRIFKKDYILQRQIEE